MSPRAVPRRLAPLAAVVGGAVLLALRQQAPSTFVGAARAISTPADVPALAGSWQQAASVPRGEAVVMQAKRKAAADRTRLLGSGRLPIRVTRNPVLAYSVTEVDGGPGSRTEPAGSVLRRMYDMYEMDFNKMAVMRDRYFRPGYRKKKWVADYNMRAGRRKKEMRIKRQYETDWQEWMSTVGRQRGLTDPVIFNGPPLANQLTPEMDAATDPKAIAKKLPSEQELATDLKLPKGADRLPEDVQPGKFNSDGADSIFKIWKRPLHKYPYDIGKRGKVGPVVRGIVM